LPVRYKTTDDLEGGHQVLLHYRRIPSCRINLIQNGTNISDAAQDESESLTPAHPTGVYGINTNCFSYGSSENELTGANGRL
jgi:hypothetical protein